MSLSQQLEQLISSGIHRIGEVEILTGIHGYEYALCHFEDVARAMSEQFGGLEIHASPEAGRDVSTWSDDGEYRFAKAMVNLCKGWVIALHSVDDLRQALDLLYPAGLGLFVAHKEGTLEAENLRDKLNRQTGMYRFARGISDEGAQKLVQEVCGPAHQCARRIMWQLDETTQLEDSEASRYRGIPGKIDESEAIPLLCREACNHFVAECRKASKAEFEAKQKQEERG